MDEEAEGRKQKIEGKMSSMRKKFYIMLRVDDFSESHLRGAFFICFWKLFL